MDPLAEAARFGPGLAKAVGLTASFEDAARKAIEFTAGYVEGSDSLQQALREQPEEALELMRPALALALTPYTDRLSARPDQIAEWVLRAVVGHVLMPPTTLDGPGQLADLLLTGILRR